MNEAILATLGEEGRCNVTTYSWTGKASTAFTDAANWLDLATGAPAGVPGEQDTVQLSGTGEIAGTGTVSAIDLLASTQGHGFYVLDGTFSSNAVSDLGELDVSQGSLLSNRIAVGSASAFGELDITQADVAALDGSLDITVSDGGAAGVAAQLNVGTQDGSVEYRGTLSVGQGSVRVGVGAGQDGLLTVIGTIVGEAASALIIGQDGGAGVLDALYEPSSITAGHLILGSSGTGQAIFSQGGTLTLGGGEGPALVLGGRSDTGSSGGTGSLQGTLLDARVNGRVVVGDTGQGSLTLDNSSLTTTDGLVIGNAQASQGEVTLQETTWADTGNVVVGNKGQGSLLITNFERDAGSYGNPDINGDVQIGVRAGAGNVTIEGATLTVAGNTVLGPSSQDTISIEGGEWNSAGHHVRLVDAQAGQDGGTLSISQGGSLVAGALVVGEGDTVESLNAGTLALGSSASGTAGSVLGRLILGQGSALTAVGNLSVGQSLSGGSENGLQLDGGSATLSATGHFALSLVGQGLASVGYGSALAATGGVLVAADSALIVDQGTVATKSSRLALNIAADGVVVVQGGTLSTSGELAVDNAHYRPGQSFGGTLMVSSGANLDSDAATPGGLAVAVEGGSAEVNAATWTVGGRFELGVNGPGGILTEQGSQIGISGALVVGGQHSYGEVSTGTTDTVDVGGALSAGQTGLSAASILVGGNGSSISTGTLDVGSASGRGSLAIDNGSVRVASAATINGVVRLGEGGSLSAQTITLDVASTVLGMGTLSGNIVDQGAITVSHGLLSCLGPVTGEGLLRVSDGTLQLGAAESVAVVFGNAGTIVTPQISDLVGTLSGWQAGDAILFSGQAIASDSYANGTLSLFDSSQALLGTEVFKGALSAGNFVLTSEQGTASLLSYRG